MNPAPRSVGQHIDVVVEIAIKVLLLIAAVVGPPYAWHCFFPSRPAAPAALRDPDPAALGFAAPRAFFLRDVPAIEPAVYEGWL